MKRISLLLIISLFAFALRAQNLVPNPSFEQHSDCPWINGQTQYATDWSININTADYYNSCDTFLYWQSVPSNGFGYQYAATGDAYFGFYAYSHLLPAAREFFGRQLSSPLIIGQRYFASFKVSLADGQPELMCGVNGLGMKFTTINYSDSSTWFDPPFINNTAQVLEASMVSDTLNWTTISGSFIADSSYQYFLIGHFLDTSNITFSCLDPNNISNRWSYYFVDDVCVSTDSLTCPVSVGVKEPRQTTMTIFPNPFSNQLTFSLADNVATTVSLYNFLGQQVFEQTFTNSTAVNTAQLAAGIYFYELRRNKGTLKTGKVVKQ